MYNTGTKKANKKTGIHYAETKRSIQRQVYTLYTVNKTRHYTKTNKYYMVTEKVFTKRGTQ